MKKYLVVYETDGIGAVYTDLLCIIVQMQKGGEE